MFFLPFYICVLGGIGYDHVPCSWPIQTGNPTFLSFSSEFSLNPTMTDCDWLYMTYYRFTFPLEQRISWAGVIPSKWSEFNLHSPFISNSCKIGSCLYLIIYFVSFSLHQFFRLLKIYVFSLSLVILFLFVSLFNHFSLYLPGTDSILPHWREHKKQRSCEEDTP